MENTTAAMALPAVSAVSGDAAPKKGVRVSIALKLVLMTTSLVLVLMGGFVSISLYEIQQQYARSAERLREVEVSSLRERALANVRNLASSLTGALFEGDIGLVSDALRSLAASDNEVALVLSVRPDGRIVARSDGKPFGDLPVAQRAVLDGITQPKQLAEPLEKSTHLAFAAPALLGTRREGTLYLEMSTQRIDEALAAIELEREAAFSRALQRTLLLGALALFIGVAIAVFQSLRITRPIRSLVATADEIGKGNLAARAQRTTSDEIGSLCLTFNEMTGRIQTLLSETAEKASIERELDVAKNIQTALMPDRQTIGVAGLSFCGFCESATQCGGDWWNYYELRDGRVLFLVGDVTGHGVPSAMLTASAKACCDTIVGRDGAVDLAALLQSLDFVIREAGKGQLVMTMLVAIVDAKARTIEYANAGHSFPLLCRQGDVKTLVARGGRLGDGGEYQYKKEQLAEGDLIVMYTDGIIECGNPAQQEYGIRRMRKFLQQHAHEPVDRVRDQLVADAYAFFDTEPRADDITLLMCRVA